MTPGFLAVGTASFGELAVPPGLWIDLPDACMHVRLASDTHINHFSKTCSGIQDFCCLGSMLLMCRFHVEFT